MKSPSQKGPKLYLPGFSGSIDIQNIKTHLPTRVGLSSHAIFRLWKMALKDDETLLDEVISSVHEQMSSLDQARAEQVMSLIIRRHRDAKEAFKATLMAIRMQSRPPVAGAKSSDPVRVVASGSSRFA